MNDQDAHSYDQKVLGCGVAFVVGFIVVAVGLLSLIAEALK